MTRKLLWLSCALIISLLVSCASKKSIQEDPIILTPTAEQSATALAAPQQKVFFFEGIDPSIILKVENGTKSDLQAALLQLKRTDENYSEEELTLISVVQGLLSILYNQTTYSLPVLIPAAVNPYTAAVESAKKGVYDFSAGQSDFFTLVLPSLVLLTAPAVQNYYPEAESSLQKGLELQTDSFLALFLYGLLLDRTNQKEASLMYLEKAYVKDPSYIPLIRLYMAALYDSGFLSKAFSTAVALLQIAPDELDALKICARISFAEKNYDAAEQYVAQVLQREPDNSDYILFRARILMDKGDYIRVSPLLDLYARSNKNAKEYLILRTRLLLEWNKNTAAASNTIQEALSLYPSDIDVLLLAASLSAQSGQKIGKYTLEDLLSQILELNPQNPDALQLTVYENMRRQQWTQAYGYSLQLLALSKNKTTLITHVEICIALLKLDEAREFFSLLLESKVDQEELALLEVKLLISEGKNTEARERIDAMISSTVAARSKSILYYERSRVASSEDVKLADLRSSLTSNPRNNEALFALYEFYFGKKDYRKAQYYLKQVVSLSPSDQRLLKLNEEIEILLAN